MLRADRSAGYRAAAPSENIWLSRLDVPGASALAPIVVYGHMLFGSADTYITRPWHGAFARLARAGFLVVCGDVGGPAGFGNDGQIDGYQAAYNYAVARGGDPDRWYYLSDSMGTWGLNWVRRTDLHPPPKACVLMLPAPNTEVAYSHTYSTGNLAPYLNLAYPPNWPGQSQAVKDTHDPQRYAAELAGIPIRLMVDANDPFFVETPDLYPDFIAAVGGSAIDMVTFVGDDPTTPQTDVHTRWGFNPNWPTDFFREHL